MNNSNYDSLTEKLIQSGIIQSNQNQKSDTNMQNPFEQIQLEEKITSSTNEYAIEIPKAMQKSKKRLNKSDFEMVSENTDEQAPKIIARFLNFKENLASKGALNAFENFLFTFFPKLYRAKLAKDAMSKFKELNIDTKKLLDKTIPYGESETRYQNLIKYINYANQIQTKIRKKTF